MVLRYKVPQNVQREDQIIWFITLRQLIVLLVTGGISYFLYVTLSKIYVLSPIEIFIVFMPLVIGAAFAFVKIKGLNLTKLCLLLLEQTIFLPGRRFWQSNTHPFVSMTQPFSLTEKKDDGPKQTKDFSREKVKNLAHVLDTGGFKKKSKRKKS